VVAQSCALLYLPGLFVIHAVRQLARSAVAPGLLLIAGIPATLSAGSVIQSPHESVADSAGVLRLTRLAAPITLDGKVDEAAWSVVAPLPLSQFQPDPGGPMRDRSEIRVAYDDRFLYAAGRFWDAEPDGIRENSLLRDYYAEDDFLNLVIDTFHDRESAVWFVVTPNATRIDGSISNDAEGAESQWNHPEFDMPWDAAATRSAEGWSVEVRIPLSSLRVEVRDGRITMGLIAARIISRRKERYIFPAIQPTAAMAQFKPSLAAPVTLTVSSPPRLFAATPYLLAGSQTRDADSVSPGSRRVGEAGMDVKVGLSSRLTLDLTVNTDFAQTEVDDQRVNLTRFSLFFPEKRQFFLERSGLFDVAMGGNDRVFYSRRIGLGADGVPVRVLGGGRFVGRVGRWDIGALDLLVRGDLEGTVENAAVVRLRRNIFNPYSYVGAIATVSGGPLHGAGHAVGFDGTVRATESNYVVWSAASTWGGAGAPSVPGSDGMSVRLALERRKRSGLSGSAELRAIGERYAPALGFVERSGIVLGAGSLTHGWVGVQGRTQERRLGISATAVHGLASRDLETATGELAAEVGFIGGATASSFVRARQEVLADTFRLGTDARVSPGRYRWVEAGVSGGTSPGGLMRVRLEMEGGAFYGGWRVSAAFRPAWNLSRHLELGGDVELNRVWLDDGAQRFAGDVVRLRARAAVDSRLSFTGALQHNRATDVTTGSLRLRYAFREGTDLFAVLNDERAGAVSTAPGLRDVRIRRYFAVKYRHTFR
jgi:hypothetical protein